MTDIRTLIASVWPEWEITGEIGQGASARVYKAQRRSRDKTELSAIKALLIPDDDEEKELLLAEGRSEEAVEAYYRETALGCSREVELMLELKHSPNIIKVLDHALLHPEPMLWLILIRMELLSPLTRTAKLSGMDEADIRRMGGDICKALAACHARSIVHGDIKPQNVFTDGQGNYLLGDFGTSKKLDTMSRSFTWRGTPSFMAPEVFKSEVGSLSPESMVLGDIYSLGMVMYWLANGAKLPFMPENRQLISPPDRQKAFERRIGGEALPKPGAISQSLSDVILKACAYRPEDRYQSAQEFSDALARASAPDDGAADKRARIMSRILIAVVALTLLAAGLFFALKGKNMQNGADAPAESAPESRLLATNGVPFPDREEYWNIYILTPPELVRTAFSSLVFSFYETKVEENWVSSTLGEGQTNRSELERLHRRNFNEDTSELRTDLVLLFLNEEELSDLFELYRQNGVAVYQLESSEPDAVREEWLRLIEEAGV